MRSSVSRRIFVDETRWKSVCRDKIDHRLALAASIPRLKLSCMRGLVMLMLPGYSGIGSRDSDSVRKCT